LGSISFFSLALPWMFRSNPWLTTTFFCAKTRMRWKETAITEVELRRGELTLDERRERALQHLNEVLPSRRNLMG
jgi:hypothetical protein